MSVKLPLWKKFVFSLTVVAFVLLLLELLIRFCGYGPAISAAPSIAVTDKVPKPNAFAYFLVCDRQLGFRNRPNGNFRSPYFHGHPVSTTDRFGYRNGLGWTADGDSPIVAFIGDSYTFCSEVNDDQTGPSQVARLLGEQFDLRVLNAGVRGYNTLQSKRLLAECLERFPTIRVAVYTYCGNDFQDNLIADVHYPVKAPVVARDAETGQFREVEVSDPAVPWGESFLNWRPPPPKINAGTRAAKWLDEHSALWHHCLLGLRQVTGKTDAEVVARRFAWAKRHGGGEALKWLLAEMDRMCRRKGVALVATTVVINGDVHTPREFAEVCKAAGVRFVDLEERFPGEPTSYLAIRTDGQYDSHYNVLGNKAYAAGLAPVLGAILRSQGISEKGATGSLPANAGRGVAGKGTGGE